MMDDMEESESVMEDQGPESVQHMNIRMQCLQLALAHSSCSHNNLGITNADTTISAAEKFYEFIAQLERVEQVYN